mmetsp:Transcript_9213/g.30739  ORF Transcript_9213/g.30739 Transcript_9213/m.30739 type:complete len:234 (+) Transcript_9213:288-989(+)
MQHRSLSLCPSSYPLSCRIMESQHSPMLSPLDQDRSRFPYARSASSKRRRSRNWNTSLRRTTTRLRTFRSSRGKWWTSMTERCKRSSRRSRTGSSRRDSSTRRSCPTSRRRLVLRALLVALAFQERTVLLASLEILDLRALLDQRASRVQKGVRDRRAPREMKECMDLLGLRDLLATRAPRDPRDLLDPSASLLAGSARPWKERCTAVSASRVLSSKRTRTTCLRTAMLSPRT